MPICTIWLRWQDAEEKTTLEILNAYVPERLRRLGLLTWTFNAMLPSLKARFIVTERGTEYSEPWLLKTGFRKHRERGWIYEVKNGNLA